jgi:ABC-type oligopeptide transport system ATPase subunit
VTFRVEKSEVFGFLGPSGAGNSTTQKILIALQRDYEGTLGFSAGRSSVAQTRSSSSDISLGRTLNRNATQNRGDVAISALLPVSDLVTPPAMPDYRHTPIDPALAVPSAV